MAKVTIVLTDNEADNTISCDADFDQPEKSYEEMVADPTLAVACGLATLKLFAVMADSYKGQIKDEFGFEREVSNANPL